MADSFTFALDGDVTLADFDRAIKALRELMDALGEELAPNTPIDWIVDEMEGGSALTTWVGEPRVKDGEAAVAAVLEGYGRTGQALESGDQVPYHGSVPMKAAALQRLVTGRIESMRIETDGVYANVRAAPLEAGATSAYSLGALVGRLEVLSDRGTAPHISLTELVDGYKVRCYLDEEQTEAAQKLWRKWVLVEGDVRRDVTTGQPLLIRHVTNIEEQPEVDPDAYRLAKGVAPAPEGAISAEEAIRRIRDV